MEGWRLVRCGEEDGGYSGRFAKVRGAEEGDGEAGAGEGGVQFLLDEVLFPADGHRERGEA